LGKLFFALFSDSFNKNIEMSVVSFCCFYIPLNKTAHGRAYWNALHTAGSVYAGSLPVPSTNLSSGQVKARTKKAYAIYGVMEIAI
jgi:hypothetical protein